MVGAATLTAFTCAQDATKAKVLRFDPAIGRHGAFYFADLDVSAHDVYAATAVPPRARAQQDAVDTMVAGGSSGGSADGGEPLALPAAAAAAGASQQARAEGEFNFGGSRGALGAGGMLAPLQPRAAAQDAAGGAGAQRGSEDGSTLSDLGYSSSSLASSGAPGYTATSGARGRVHALGV